ncbi:hypothetical protein Lal_00007285 [Lupinus albus]|uniref:Uncharacterized protein n=1 Tax=Lupinus albus TaxID=3870 RepID=A0A6A5MIA7_LUPAL|nr:hypothetical protein Lalb_Chr16g0379981 [Lupinus albus]KAF1874671.1 hypothetical protein Lal_00007285 [Lupinus albus]
MAHGFGKPMGYQMLLLKDYLRDDLSSCSSSGFKSLPRRQCCPQPLFSSPSSSSTKSVLQKASESVLNAIKSLTNRSPSSLSRTQRCKAKKGGGGVLCKSLSRRLMNKSFWRIRAPSTQSHFTHNEGSVTTTNTFSASHSTRRSEEKEQFSPVSVLDCPLFDDDEEITSPFSSTPSSALEGTKHKKKGQHFNGVGSLKPVALEKRMQWSIMHEDEAILYNHPIKPTPTLVLPNMCKSDMVCDNIEENVRDLVNHVKRSIPSSNSLRNEAEKLLFDFFKQSISENNNNDIEDSIKQREYLRKVAEEWISGQPHQKQNKQSLSLRIRDEEEIQHLAMELELDLSSRLINNLVLELIN